MTIKTSVSFLIKLGKIILFSFIILMILSSCMESNNGNNLNQGNFKKDKKNQVHKLDYWAENNKEWQITNNKIECLVSRRLCKIRVLNKLIENKNGTVEMKIQMGFFNTIISNLNKNWAGFHLGTKNTKFNNVAIYQKKGINIGICTNGSLFIGNPSPNKKNIKIINALKNGVNLKLFITKQNNSYTIDFSVLDFTSKKVLGRISKKNIAPEQLTGSIALISNFENTNYYNNNKKSVWFQNCEIKGSNITILANNKIN